MTKDSLHILIVDDDESTRASLRLVFRRRGYEIEEAETGRAALEKARARFFNLTLLDIGLPDMEGIELVAPLKEMHPDMVVILVTGYASLETAVRAMNEGASAYIIKPLNMSKVLDQVEEALEKQYLVLENRRLYQQVQRELAERERAEAQLRQQERIAAVGQLAGGIAHDFNNFLTTIMLYSEMILSKPHLPPSVTSGLDIILTESRGAARLVQQILDFGRRSKMELRPLDLGAFIHRITNVLRRTLPENIRLIVKEDGAVYGVNVDRTRLQQMLVNLVVNARDAMPEGGDLLIGLSRIEIQVPADAPLEGMPAGKWTCLTVLDHGIGMSPEVMSHLYEPYFTTKPVGKGTGLGLAQVSGIVEQHNGYIKVESEVGRGTTFRVYVPTLADETEQDKDVTDTLAPPAGKGETILLVEDKDKVLEVGQKTLEALGYRVLMAANGREALRAYELAENVDLLITDIVMPEMGGRELVQELRKVAPNLKVLAITGYAVTKELHELREDGLLEIVSKPFEMHTLATIIRRMLDEG